MYELGEVDEAALRTRLAAGVETADGTYEADLLGFEPPATLCVGVAEGKHRMVRRMLANAGTLVESCRFGVDGPASPNHFVGGSLSLSPFMICHQRPNNTGHGVLSLHRIRYGTVDLGDLPVGKVLEFPPDSAEGRWAQGLLAGGRPKPPRPPSKGAQQQDEED